MANYSYGVAVNTKMTVFNLREGRGQNGRDWQLFTFNERRKGNTGSFETCGTYTIFVNNIQSLQNGDIVKVVKITNAKQQKNAYNGKEYCNCIINCEIEKIKEASQVAKNQDINDNNFNFDVDFEDI